MKLLITGGSGVLGRRAARHFRELGWQVLTPTHARLDITQEKDVEHWFAENRPQTVLHCAAVSNTGACQREPARTARINVDGSVYLAAACGEIGAKLVLCSSDQVYSGSDLPGPHKETETLFPNNVYGRQKLLAEQRCGALCPDTVSLRLSWMYCRYRLEGEHGNFLDSLVSAIKDPALPLSWPVFDRRGITDVDTVVENLGKAVSLPAGVYNFGSGNDASTCDTVKSVLETLGLQAALVRMVPNLESFADSPRDIRMDSSRTESAGILFPSTREGLLAALPDVIMKQL